MKRPKRVARCSKPRSKTAFARELLAEAVAHWQAHRHQFPAAKFLVVAPRIGLARRYAELAPK